MAAPEKEPGITWTSYIIRELLPGEPWVVGGVTQGFGLKGTAVVIHTTSGPKDKSVTTKCYRVDPEGARSGAQIAIAKIGHSGYWVDEETGAEHYRSVTLGDPGMEVTKYVMDIYLAEDRLKDSRTRPYYKRNDWRRK